MAGSVRTPSEASSPNRRRAAERLRYTERVKRSARALLPALLLFGLLVAGGCRAGAEAGSRADNVATPDALLVERLAIAYGALRQAGGARRIDGTHRNAQAAIDALVGPSGRHGKPYAPPGGILPGEGTGADPGLALRAYDAAPAADRLRPILEGQLTTAIDGWRTPAGRYDAIDLAVAEVRAGRAAEPALSGDADRALAWALLSLESTEPLQARQRAERGASALHATLDAIRRARAGGT